MFVLLIIYFRLDTLTQELEAKKEEVENMYPVSRNFCFISLCANYYLIHNCLEDIIIM